MIRLHRALLAGLIGVAGVLLSWGVAAHALPLHSMVRQPTPLTQMLDLSFVDTRHGWALGAACGVGNNCAVALRATTDGGRTWHPIPAPAVSPAWYSYAPAAALSAGPDVAHLRFATTRVGWLYDPSLFVTYDGGVTWTRQRSPWATAALAPVGASVWALQGQCVQPSQRCSFRSVVSTDTGRTWHAPAGQPRLSGPQQVQLVRADAGHAWILAFGGVHGALLATADGGRHWQALDYPCDPAGSFIDRLAALGDRDLWLMCGGPPSAGIELKYLYRSADGGAHWRLIAMAHASGASSLTLGGYLADLAVTGAARGWLALSRDTLYSTHDGGATWRRAIPLGVANPLVSALGPLVFVDPMHGWLRTQDQILRTTDGGAQWQAITLT